ncbi:MAG: prepilin peptidase [Acidobacteria bacterium]|nr:prepilin peptidase [Acidobacteriota bacterium]
MTTELIFIWTISTAVLLPSAVIDARTHRIPNFLSIGGSFLAVALRFLFFMDNSPILFLAAGIYGLALFLLVERVFRNRLGFGDIKLSFFIAVCLGFWGWHITVFTASLSGIIMYILKKKPKGSRLAFAPYLFFAAVVSLFLITFNIVPLPV